MAPVPAFSAEHYEAESGSKRGRRITSWNAGAARLYGYAEAEAIGLSISIIAPPELRNELSQIFDRLRRGRRIETYETVRMKKDGTRVQVSLTVSPVLDSTHGVVGASAIART